MPMVSVTAKPRTGAGAEPEQHQRRDQRRHVGVDNGGHGAGVAGLDRSHRRFARPDLLADALVDQHVGVDRDADGEHDAGDAGQGQRGADQREDAEDQRDVDEQREIGKQPEEAVGREHEDDDERETHQRRLLARGDGVGAEARADGPLLDGRELGRQRTGAEQHGEVVGALDGEIAADLAGAAEDRLVDARRGDHLAVKQNGKGQPDILLRDLAEALGAGGVEAEGHDRLVGVAVERGLRIDQILPGQEHLVLQHVGNRRFLFVVSEHIACRHALAGRRLAGVDRWIDHLEFELTCLADEILQALDILDAGHLHENAVAAFALDDRLGGAELVDAPSDGLDRGLDRGAHALIEADIGDGQRDLVLAASSRRRGRGRRNR